MAKTNKGFTLAEVLIALTIIGIIAAITVPVIMASHQKEALKSAFTKTYSELNNAARKFYSDNGISLSEYAAAGNSYASAIMSYYNRGETASKITYSTASEDYDLDYNLKLLSGQQLGSGASTEKTVCDNSSLMSDLSGKLYRFNDRPVSGYNGPIVCVDTNGLKGPNQYGKDYFLFIFTVDNQVIPMGMEHSNNAVSTSKDGNFFLSGSSYCDKKSRGNTGIKNATCAYYALNDISPSDSSKSYWKDFI